MGRKPKAGTAGRADNPEDPVAARYPHIAAWILDGWIEVGQTADSPSCVRALDMGGLVWEGQSQYATLDEALQDLDAGIAAWLDERGG